MGFARVMLSKERMGNSQEFILLQSNGRGRVHLSALPPSLTCDATDMPSANSSPLLPRPTVPLAAICLQTERLTRSISLLAAALCVFPFQRGFLSFLKI